MNAPTLALLALAALTALAGAGAVFAWRAFRAVLRDRTSLAERLGEVAARLGVAEQEIARAAIRAEVAESVLLDKGLADEEDLALARRQVEVSFDESYRPERDGDLH